MKLTLTVPSLGFPLNSEVQEFLHLSVCHEILSCAYPRPLLSKPRWKWARLPHRKASSPPCVGQCACRGAGRAREEAARGCTLARWARKAPRPLCLRMKPAAVVLGEHGLPHVVTHGGALRVLTYTAASLPPPPAPGSHQKQNHSVRNFRPTAFPDTWERCFRQ